MNRWISAWVCAVCVLAVQSGAEAGDNDAADTVALHIGINFSVLDRPNDAVGDPTLLAGSAFTGAGFVVGASYEFGQNIPLVNLEAGLFYAHSTATGFELLGEQEREVLLQADTVRLPLIFKGRYEPLEGLRLFGGVGPELVLGLTSGSTIRERNVPDSEAASLPTVSVTTFNLAIVAGIEFDAGPVSLPLTFRFGINPLVGDTTSDRLDGSDPAALRMEFDYEFIGLLGVAFDI